MKLVYALLCWLGFHRIGEVRQWGTMHPNAECEHCHLRM